MLPQDVKNRFSTKKRPLQVAAWIKRKHLLDHAPDVDDVPLFVSEMQDWYLAAQPEGRGDTFPLARDVLEAGQWHDLIRGGANGWQLFLIALTWWADFLEEESDTELFESVLADVDWVLSRVLGAARERIGAKPEAPSGSSLNVKRYVLIDSPDLIAC